MAHSASSSFWAAPPWRNDASCCIRARLAASSTRASCAVSLRLECIHGKYGTIGYYLGSLEASCTHLPASEAHSRTFASQAVDARRASLSSSLRASQSSSDT